MKNIKQALAEAAKPMPYIGSLSEHPFALLIMAYLESIGVGEESKREVSGEIVWSTTLEPGLSVAYRLYKDRNQEVFLHFEVAIGYLPEASEDLIAATLLQEQYNHHFPLFYAITEERLLVILFRTYCDGITAAHALLRIHTIITLGAHSREVFVKPEFGLQPLPSSWFKKAQVA